MTKEQIMAEAMALEPDERQQLADGLHLSALGLTVEEIEAAWAKEVRRRIAALERGEAKTIPGEQVMRELKERYAQ